MCTSLSLSFSLSVPAVQPDSEGHVRRDEHIDAQVELLSTDQIGIGDVSLRPRVSVLGFTFRGIWFRNLRISSRSRAVSCGSCRLANTLVIA